ncbi:diguanylate cyclase [uncultured Desulfovibrio sp.]|uniref:GGDEF domain-containing protein n=1 Tax=uncultured Desulfovibrio sp. TaxID=167968 RepID=UPI003208F63C
MSPLLSSPTTLLPGFWQFTPAQDIFWLDRDCLALVGRTDTASRSMPGSELRDLLHIDPEEESLFQQVVESPAEGDVLLCSITLYAGPYSGRQCAVRASVMGRDADGRALSLVGNIRLLSDTGVDDPGVNPDMALLTLDISGDGMWDWFPKTGRVEYSPRFRAMLGYSPLQFPNSMEAWENIIHTDDRMRANRALYNIVEPHGANYFECTFRLRGSRGDYLWILCRGQVLRRDTQGRALRVMGMITDISASQQDHENLLEKAYSDQLTGLGNRASLDMHVREWAQPPHLPLSILYCDVSGLKLVNDTLGHNVGDALLISAAHLLKNAIKTPHVTIRQGGDEFLVVLPRCSALQAEELVFNLRVAIQKHNDTEGCMPLFISVGHATLEKTAADISETIARADHHMLRNKALAHETTYHQLKCWLEALTSHPVSLFDSRRD